MFNYKFSPGYKMEKGSLVYAADYSLYGS